MEKLEVKHLSAYLPYQAVVQVIREDQSVDYVKLSAAQASLILDDYHFDPKLVLRPLSDLTEPIIHNGEKITAMDDNENSYFDYSEVSFETNNGIDTISTTTDYRSFQILLELKFDVFGLIGKNIAVSVHDLTENPYK